MTSSASTTETSGSLVTLKRTSVTDFAEIEQLIIKDAECIETGLRITDSNLRVGQTMIDLVGLDVKNSLVLIALGQTADEGMPLRILDASAWFLAHGDVVRRLYPAADLRPGWRPRVFFIAEHFSDSFRVTLKQVAIPGVDYVQVLPLRANGAMGVYFETLEQVKSVDALLVGATTSSDVPRHFPEGNEAPWRSAQETDHEPCGAQTYWITENIRLPPPHDAPAAPNPEVVNQHPEEPQETRTQQIEPEPPAAGNSARTGPAGPANPAEAQGNAEQERARSARAPKYTFAEAIKLPDVTTRPDIPSAEPLNQPEVKPRQLVLSTPSAPGAAGDSRNTGNTRCYIFAEAIKGQKSKNGPIHAGSGPAIEQTDGVHERLALSLEIAASRPPNGLMSEDLSGPIEAMDVSPTIPQQNGENDRGTQKVETVTLPTPEESRAAPTPGRFDPYKDRWQEMLAQQLEAEPTQIHPVGPPSPTSRPTARPPVLPAQNTGGLPVRGSTVTEAMKRHRQQDLLPEPSPEHREKWKELLNEVGGLHLPEGTVLNRAWQEFLKDVEERHHKLKNRATQKRIRGPNEDSK